MTPPFGRHIAEYCACPEVMPRASLTVAFWIRSSAPRPESTNSPMCETSKRPAASRTARCSEVMPEGYCTGIS
jgi:hypothetical protein